MLVLLDLIGSADTKFVNWFTETQPLYDRLRDIGIISYLFFVSVLAFGECALSLDFFVES